MGGRAERAPTEIVPEATENILAELKTHPVILYSPPPAARPAPAVGVKLMLGGLIEFGGCVGVWVCASYPR